MIKAVKDGSGYVLKSDTELQPAIDAGFSIYQETDEGETLLASPEDGWLEEKPAFGPTACSAAGSGSIAMAEALDIILNGE